MSIDWGDAPTWVAGAFAAAAAYYTRGMLKSQRQQITEQRQFIAEQSANLELERAELRAQADDRRISQARAVWAGRQRGAFVVENGSDAVLRNVTVTFDGMPATSAYEMVDAGIGDIVQFVGDYAGEVVAIGPGRRFAFRSGEEWGPVVDDEVAFFQDEAGVRWRLSGDGVLEEAPEAPS
ncbi:hypothetical protein [Streptomyces hydrogenans]|uniref:hypothetical protein n=1 Tax=Streptomyces hydrogenans TaxID=1873719 RepID=UPI0038036984